MLVRSHTTVTINEFCFCTRFLLCRSCLDPTVPRSPAVMSLLRVAATRTVLRAATVQRAAAATAGSATAACPPQRARCLSSSTRLAAASAASGKSAAVWKVDNPYTGEVVAEVPQITAAQASQLVQQAEQAYRGFRTTTLAQRVALINKSAHHTHTQAHTERRMRGAQRQCATHPIRRSLT